MQHTRFPAFAAEAKPELLACDLCPADRVILSLLEVEDFKHGKSRFQLCADCVRSTKSVAAQDDRLCLDMGEITVVRGRLTVIHA